MLLARLPCCGLFNANSMAPNRDRQDQVWLQQGKTHAMDTLQHVNTTCICAICDSASREPCYLQGNGHERDKLHFQDDDLYIFDMYNCQLWPADSKAKAAIDCDKPIVSGTGDAEYLARLAEGLAASFSKFSPDIVLYNAGTDILVGDPLGA